MIAPGEFTIVFSKMSVFMCRVSAIYCNMRMDSQHLPKIDCNHRPGSSAKLGILLVFTITINVPAVAIENTLITAMGLLVVATLRPAHVMKLMTTRRAPVVMQLVTTRRPALVMKLVTTRRAPMVMKLMTTRRAPMVMELVTTRRVLTT